LRKAIGKDVVVKTERCDNGRYCNYEKSQGPKSKEKFDPSVDGLGLGSVGAKYLRPVGAVERSSCSGPRCSRALFFEGPCDHQSKSGGYKELQDMYEGRNNARYIANGQRHGGDADDG
jgi:hypothetical protein